MVAVPRQVVLSFHQSINGLLNSAIRMNPVELSLLGGRKCDQEENNAAILLEFPHAESVSFRTLVASPVAVLKQQREPDIGKTEPSGYS